MTFQKILNDLSMDLLSVKDAYSEMSSKEKMKRINFYSHINDIRKDPLTDGQLQELESIVNVLQILYNSAVGSPVSDYTYDILQEILVEKLPIYIVIQQPFVEYILFGCGLFLPFFVMSQFINKYTEKSS